MKLGKIRLRPAVYGILATTLASVMTASSIAAAETESCHAYTNPETKEAYYNAYSAISESQCSHPTGFRLGD